MKKLLILIILIFNLPTAHTQNLKGSAKYGSEYQKGKPFEVTFRSLMFGKFKEGKITTELPISTEVIVLFNFNNENKIKVMFPKGKHNIIYNINNIVKTSYRQEAEGGNQDGHPYNNMTVYLENNNLELTIVDNKRRDVVKLTRPK